MKELMFISPLHDEMQNPSMEHLQDAILKGGADYWSGGPGEGYMKYKSDTLSARLYIRYNEDYGFYLNYGSPEGEFHSLGESNDLSPTVVVNIGGNDVLYPPMFFISPKEALLAIQEFYEAGQKTDKVNWINDDDVQFDWDAWLV